MIKQFEVGKSYYREIPTNPNFAVVEECEKLGLKRQALMESIVAINFLLSTDGFISFNSLIEHVRNGFLETTLSILNLFK